MRKKQRKRNTNFKPVKDLRSGKLQFKKAVPCVEDNSKKEEKPEEHPKQHVIDNKRSNAAAVQKDENRKDGNEEGCSDTRNDIECSSGEEYFDSRGDPNRFSLDKETKPSSSKVDRSTISCENDSDLESIPTVSYFKQRAWIGRRSDTNSSESKPNSFNENGETKRPFDKDGYVEGKWRNNRLIDLRSSEFTHPYDNQRVYVRKQNPGYLFTFDNDYFIARVHFNKLDELDFGGHPIYVKRCFLQKLMIVKVIEDKLTSDYDEIYNRFMQLLQDRSCETAGNLEWAEDIFQLSLILEKHGSSSNSALILEDVTRNEKISSEVRDRGRELLCKETIVDSRRLNFPQAGRSNGRSLLEELRRICKDSLVIHRNSISAMVPFSLEDHINKLRGKLVLYITKNDMELFVDLVNLMSEEPYLDFVNNLWDAYFQKVNQIRECGELSSLRDFVPSTHPIYFYLCKSLQELIAEIGSTSDSSANDLLINKCAEWSLLEVINWSTTSPLTQSLEQQYRQIFKIMKQLKPGYYSDKTELNKTLWQRTKSWLFSGVYSSKEISAIPKERLVWIRIFEDTINKIASKEELKLFEPLLNGYTDFIRKTERNQYESFRVVMHSVIRFIAQTFPYLSKNDSEIDKTTMAKQIRFINETISTISEEQFNDFRDLINVYNEYWKNRETIIEKIPDQFPHGKFKLDMEGIRQNLHDIVNTALDIATKPQGLIKYFRAFNEFLEDLGTIKYSWYVKKISYVTQEEVALIDKNKGSYMILDAEKFIEKHSVVPRHYIIEIVQDLLNKVIDLLERKGKWSKYENLNAASTLLAAIKKSFLYLKDQPNYASFDTFKEESTLPFVSVIENSSSYEDFEKRVGIIGESFWYLRKQDEIDIKQALLLYKSLNGDSTLASEEILRNCYTIYLDRFDSYIKNTCNETYEDKIRLIIEELITEFREQPEKRVNKWEGTFKRSKVPVLLAGLAAVWSVQASKDIVATEKCLKPHCIQILCILRLLGVDEDSTGVNKHLAQVLTGQGKSLVLGLLSTLLALMGHKVRTVCYSEYLATRDQQDFSDFFQLFHISNNITYGTFVDMANETLEPEINGKRRGLRELVQDRVLNRSTKQSGQVIQDDISNTILLIDEVDVFFSDDFYGNTYRAVCTIIIPSLSSIQERIWESVCKNDKISTVLTELDEFVKKKEEERSEDFRAFITFLRKPGKYFLLINKDNVILSKEYTNRSLYEEHLKTMVEEARNVAKGDGECCYTSEFKIDDYGHICCRRSDGYYSASSICNYYNMFNYFRLKKGDYDHKGYVNYGYLQLKTGQISYAKLPERYPLILGVTGTLTMLNDHENDAIRKSYNINKRSIMPSYFGKSNLKFDQNKDVACRDSVDDWLNKICSRANSTIDSGRSVLIFFDTDKDVDKFQRKFAGKFDRLHVLTEDTDQGSKKKYIDEAGIVKTVTIATRGMGRGVDFKSSVAVETNGGVHVIQTFFSLDIKEEIQIKGRTARKDNQGSYELILCAEHLIRQGFVGKEAAGTAVDYHSLNNARHLMVKQKGSTNETNIKKSEDNHKTTMDFLESFFEE